MALHALNDSVVHRDIKSFNFLVDHQLNAKLADLELGSNTDDLFEIKNIDDNSLFDSDFLTNWIAPEVLQQAPYTQASDIYAMSLVFWEIFSKEIPYSEKNNVSTRAAIINKLRPDLNHDGFQLCPEIMRSLIIAGWSEEPLVRPVASDFVSVIESIWLTHGVTGLSVLESKSGDIMNKLIMVDEILSKNEIQKSDMSVPTTNGNNSRLMSIQPLYEIFDLIENSDIWKIVRNLGECAMMCSGAYPHMFLQCSVEWEQLTGYFHEHLFGYNMRDLLFSPRTHRAASTNGKSTTDASDANSDSQSQSFENFLSSLHTTHVGHCVITICTPLGTKVTISLHASPIFKSLYEGSTSSDNPSWSGAVPYERTIAFYKLTATVLTQIEADENHDEEENNIFSKMLRKFSVDGGSLFPPLKVGSRFSGRSSNRTSGRRSGRSSGRSSGSGSRFSVRDSKGRSSNSYITQRASSVDLRSRSASEVELSLSYPVV